MTVLTRWEPFREFSTLQDRMNRLFRETQGNSQDESLIGSSFAPAVDVYEDEHNVTLKIEVPGIAEKVQADYDKGVLKITLPKKAEAKPKQIKVNVGQSAGQKTIESKGPSKAA